MVFYRTDCERTGFVMGYTYRDEEVAERDRIIERLLKGHDEGCSYGKWVTSGPDFGRSAECQCGHTDAVEQAKKLLSP